MAFVLTCTLAIASSAQDRDDQNRDQHQQMDQNRDTNHNDRADNQRWENRNGWEYRTYDRDQHPDGWMQGEHADSRYCEGHNGCYSYQYQGQPYYYYRNDDGRMVVRRKHDWKGDHDRDDHHDRDDQH